MARVRVNDGQGERSGRVWLQADTDGTDPVVYYEPPLTAADATAAAAHVADTVPWWWIAARQTVFPDRHAERSSL